MNHNGNNIESRLWDAADELRANSKLKSSEYSVPVLGLVFLRYADHKFQAAAKELAGRRQRAAEDRPGGLSGPGRALPARGGAFLGADQTAGGGQHRRGHQRRHARHRGGEPRPQGCPAQDLQPLRELPAQGTAQDHELRPHGHRGGRLRQDLRILPRPLRHERGPEGRRVLHPHRHRPAHRRDHRAVPRAHLRPGLRLRRHVRPERPVCRRNTRRTPAPS